MKSQKELIEYYKKQVEKIIKSYGVDSEFLIHANALLRGAKLGYGIEDIIRYADKKLAEYQQEEIEINKTLLVVIDENTLGYIDNIRPNRFSVLNRNHLSDLDPYGNYDTNVHNIRLATEQDFERLKVVMDGYKNDGNYIYEKN